jgi:DNA-binding MarR family transcriptional regulator
VETIMPPSAPASSDEPALSKFLCFALYSANLAMGRAYKPLLDELGLTYTQYIALVALSDGDGQMVSELGEKLFLESNTLTPILKKLEQAGYLVRRRDPADERQVRLSLTDAGREVVAKNPGMALFDATGLDEESFPVLQREMAKLRDNLLRAQKGETEKG